MSEKKTNNKIELIKSEQLKSDVPNFKAGDTVKVHTKIKEGAKERIQIFQGVVIACKGGRGSQGTFTVRKVSYGVGVEKTFLLHSPRIDQIEVVTHGDVRRAKLYYLRDRSGKSARIKTKRKTGGNDSTQQSTDSAAKPDVSAKMAKEEAPVAAATQPAA